MTRQEKKEELIGLFLHGAITIGDLIDECFEFGQQHPRWISVEDELPKEWERVLCHGYDKRSKLGHGLIFVTCRENKNNYSNYSHDGNGFVVNVPAPFKRVTHWMPLPQQPAKLSNVERTGKNEL